MYIEQCSMGTAQSWTGIHDGRILQCMLFPRVTSLQAALQWALSATTVTFLAYDLCVYGYVHMGMCVHVCMVHAYVCTLVWSVCSHMCTHVCACMCMCVRGGCACVCVCTFMCRGICVCVCVHV